MTSQKLTTLLLTVTLFSLLVGCAQPAPPVAPTAVPDEVLETTGEATPTAVQQPGLTILAEGEIKTGRPVLPLAFNASGTMLTLNVAPGDQVAEGEVIATLNDADLQDTLLSANLKVEQSQNSLAQAEADLERLLTWEPDEDAIAAAEANIASAEASLANARSQDAAAGNSLTSAEINVAQAQRELASAQEQYDNAFSPGREWEVGYNEPICDPGEIPPCMGITWGQRIESDREISTQRLLNAQEQLQIAEANLAVESARVSSNSATGARATLVNAQRELATALKGPTEAEIEAAELNVAQAELVLEQDLFAQQQAQTALEKAQLVAPWAGTVLSVEAALGATVTAGSPVVTLLDDAQLEFHTTNLSERDLSQIELGQTARVTLKAYPLTPLTGEVVRIGLESTGVIGDAAVFPVMIRLDEAEQVVRVGMTGEAEILLTDD